MHVITVRPIRQKWKTGFYLNKTSRARFVVCIQHPVVENSGNLLRKEFV